MIQYQFQKSSEMQDEETEYDDVPQEAILQAIASIDKITDELEEYQCNEATPLIDYDESFETTDGEEIRDTLDTVIKNEEILFDSLPVMVDYDESFEASADDIIGSADSLTKIQGGNDRGCFVDPYQQVTNPVEVCPLGAGQATFNRARSSRKSPAGTVGLSEEFNVLEVHPQSEGAAGDTNWQGKGNPSPKEAAHLEDSSYTESALDDYNKKDQAEGFNKEDTMKSPRAESLTPELLILACDDILDSGFKRTPREEEYPVFSTPNAIGIASPDLIDKDFSSSSGFSEEGACASEGGMLVPSNVRTAHTLSELYVKAPSTPPPATFTLEPDDSPDNSKELNSSCNSNSPEKIFPLQMASANTDLLSANTNNNTNANNINRNNNVLIASKSEGSLTSPPPSSGIPVTGSFSSTSTTTEGTMFSAQDTLSFNTIVDSDDDYQEDLLLIPDFDVPVVDVTDDGEEDVTQTTTL